MKKFSIILAVMTALCISSFAQKKAVIDPCLSKDPKIRATSKKPCPSAPAPKKKTTVIPSKGTDESKTTDETSDSDDSPSNGKPNTKTNQPPKSKPKNNEDSGSMFFVTIIHNGEKTELAYTQFEDHDGNATIEGGGRLMFFYGAGNSKKNDDDFMFNGMIPTAAKGSYPLGTNGVSFAFKADKFSNVPIFLCNSGGYEITAMPLTGGFVEGTFTANCIGEIRDDGSSEKYVMNGRFKLLRMS